MRNLPPATKKDELPKVLFVHDPISDKHYNLLPLFFQMSEHWYCKDGPTDMARRIQEVLDYMSTSVITSNANDHPALKTFERISDLNMVLIHLRKAFEDMTNV